MKVTQEMIDETLDIAVENGYDLDDWSAEDLAIDIADYDASLEGVDVELLEPLIKNWQERRKG